MIIPMTQPRGGMITVLVDNINVSLTVIVSGSRNSADTINKSKASSLLCIYCVGTAELVFAKPYGERLGYIILSIIRRTVK